jgi:hypothetical protein
LLSVEAEESGLSSSNVERLAAQLKDLPWALAALVVMLLLFRGADLFAAPQPAARANKPDLEALIRAPWAREHGPVRLRVCWLPLDLGGRTFANAQFAPELASAVAEHKAWVREIVEAQWNRSPGVRFVGFGECDASDYELRIRPMASTLRACPGADTGQSCTDEIGHDVRKQGARMALNLLFGEEFWYASLSAQEAGTAAPPEELDSWWLPSACLQEFRAPWSLFAQGSRCTDPRTPEVRAEFRRVYKRCLQNNALHEFGHVLGFLHPPHGTARASIMSYERTDASPALAPGDLAVLRATYP